MRIRLYILLLAIICSSNIVVGQMTINTTQTPQQLVQNVLLGSGITVSNVNFSGSLTANPGRQIGSFNVTGTGNLGINSGILMSTGKVTDIPGANSGITSTDFTNTGDADLSLLANKQTNDGAILEFDFIPQGDTVKFRYVFASEEYPDYVCSDYNDVFGFFISGPGISGPYSGGIAKNIALIPNTNLPVSINSVNPGTPGTSASGTCNGAGESLQYSQYYLNNNQNSFVFGGFTVVLTAISAVTCGQTYHLKIAIADGIDWSYDSGVFLEAGSLSSNPPLDLSSSSQITNVADTILYEGCEGSRINLKRFGVLTNSLTVNVVIQGTATNNADYSGIPNSVTFQAGSDTVSMWVAALADALFEPLESIKLMFIVPPTGCSPNSDTSYYDLYILDPPPINITLTPDQTVTCPGESVTLNAQASGSVVSFLYSWNTNPVSVSNQIVVQPTTTTTYTFTVTDMECVTYTSSASVTVTVPVYPPLVLAPLRDTALCLNSPLDVTAIVSGGAPPYSYNWTPNPDSDNLYQTVFTGNNIIGVGVTDVCNAYVSDSMNAVVINLPFTITPLRDTVVCAGAPLSFEANAIGGSGNFVYNWIPSGSTDSLYFTNPTAYQSFAVSVTDQCTNVGDTSNTVQIEVQHSQAGYNYYVGTESNLQVVFENTSVGANYYFWNFGDHDTSSQSSPIHLYDDPGTYNVSLVTFSEIGCKDSVSYEITILPDFYIYVPNSFTANNDGKNDVFKAYGMGISVLKIDIFDRWGTNIHSINNVDEYWDGKNYPEGVYQYVMYAKGTRGDVKRVAGSVTLLR